MQVLGFRSEAKIAYRCCAAVYRYFEDYDSVPAGYLQNVTLFAE